MNYNEENVLEKDMALQPVKIKFAPESEYGSAKRKWQGIPGIERTKKGRLWATFYSGGETECPYNYVVLIKSDDDGASWSEPILAVDPPGEVRAYDPCLWHDTCGQLWLFWAQSYGMYDGRCGVWASICKNPDDNNPVWSDPRRIANGIMMNKPTVLTTGEWLLPCAVWGCYESEFNNIPEERYSNVYISTDEGENFSLRGSADIPNRCFDEHMIIERKDGSLWMLVRTYYGIGESISYDRGKTWSTGRDSGINGPNSRFFIRRLRSGNLLIVNHYNFSGRNNLTAMISEDDGITRKGYLLIDERDSVSYPDGIQTEDGRIYIIYDRERTQAKEILMSVFTENDVLEGKYISDGARIKVIISKARGGEPFGE